MAVADTSFLVALFDQDDRHHDDARTSMRSTDHVLISTEILIETLGVIKSKQGRKAARLALDGLIRLENIGWEENCDLMAAYRLCQRKNMGSISDALVIDQCLRLETDLLTYDKKQSNILKELQS